MTEKEDTKSLSNRARFLLAVVLIGSALLLGVVAPVKALVP